MAPGLAVSAAPAQPAGRRIGLVPCRAAGADIAERGNQALKLVESMLWAFQGMTRVGWTVSRVEKADVIVVAGPCTAEELQTWNANGKPIIQIVLADEPGPPADHALTYPFRATQLLHLLNDIDARLDSTNAAVPAEAGESPVAEDSAARSAWSFLEALRTLRAVQNSAVWLAALRGRTPLFLLKGDGTEYGVDSATLQDLRRGGIPLGSLQLRQSTDLPPGRSVRSAEELAWFAGYHAGDDLAPWLDPSAAFRVSRWPNFGLIRPLPSQIRVTAMLAAGALTVQQLMQRGHIPKAEAIRTLNALEACSLLQMADGAATAANAPRPATVQPPGGLGSFLRLVRKKLGLGEAR